MTRCKFHCHNVRDFRNTAGEGSVVIEAHPAYSGDENKSWNKSTPSGSFSITVDNPAAHSSLPVVGQEFYLDLTLIEKK